MEPTPIHPKGWTQEDAKIIAEYVADVKKTEVRRKKDEWRKTKELEAGRHRQSEYFHGRNVPADVPAIRKQAGWLAEQRATEKPFGYHDKMQRIRNLFIFIVASLIVFGIIKALW